MSASIPISSNSVLDLNATVGRILIGNFIATTLWGITCLQTLFYYTTYERDKWHLKVLVLLLWLLNTAHEALCVRAVWDSLIPAFGNLANAMIIQPEFMYQIAISGIVATAAQWFFTWRIWRFSGKWIFPVVLIPLAFAHIVGCTVYTVEASAILGKQQSFLTTRPVVRLALALSIMAGVGDVIIAVTMCTLLWRGRTGGVSTDRMLLRLVNASVSTGMCTVIFAWIISIGVGIRPNDFFYFLGQIPLCPAYCNAVLANLNCRKYIKDSDVSDEFEHHPSSIFPVFKAESTTDLRFEELRRSPSSMREIDNPTRNMAEVRT